VERHALVFKLKNAACRDEYKKRHYNIWPEVRDALKRAGYTNYSIWNYGDLLFAYYESDKEKGGISDETLLSEKYFNDWRNWMEDVIFIDLDGKKEWPMDLMFYLA
jgi:L-rhamnose mutarotase